MELNQQALAFAGGGSGKRAQTVPLIVLGSFTGTTAGQIELDAPAGDEVFLSMMLMPPVCFAYAPENTLAEDQPAGWYYAQASSRTELIVYDLPRAQVEAQGVPAVLPLFTGDVPGNTNAAPDFVPLIDVRLPAAALGKAGRLNVSANISAPLGMSLFFVMNDDDVGPLEFSAIAQSPNFCLPLEVRLLPSSGTQMQLLPLLPSLLSVEGPATDQLLLQVLVAANSPEQSIVCYSNWLTWECAQ